LLNFAKIRPFFLSTLGGLLLFAGWPTSPLVSLLFVGLVPFLLVSDAPISPLRKWGLYYWGLLVWNACTTWWVCYASLAGGLAAIFLNALLMSVPFILYDLVKSKFGSPLCYLSFLIFWIGFEKIHLTWEFTWPWLTIGNGLAMYPKFIQWYSYTGHLGGSFWIILINLLIYQLLFKAEKKAMIGSGLLSVVFVPLLLSLYLFNNNAEKPIGQLDVAIVQPNIDPYNEKFESGTSEQQLAKFFHLADSIVGGSTNLLLFPETALPSGVWIKDLAKDESMQVCQQFVSDHEHLNLLRGATLIEEYDNCATASASPLGSSGRFVDIFNAAFFLQSEHAPQFYYKSKLVPCVERMPYPAFFRFLNPLLINLGGSSQSLGTQAERSNFVSDSFIVSPVICYESVFGSYVANYIRKKSNLIAIITNDGWWQDTEGHRQHLHYASLRAIETHRCIARCANTGVSCFISEKGEIKQATNWWVATAIRSKLPLYDDETFFVRYGDLLEWEFVYGSIIFIVALLLKLFLK
jgi:apolipoprotein N-acyltransferase